MYLYFCPDDTTVALDDVKGIGTYGVWDTLGKKNGRQPMNELQPLRFYQRMWTKRHRDGAPVLVGKPAGRELLRADDEPRYPGGWTVAGVISQAPVEIGQLCLINAEPLSPPHEPQMFGGEFESGTATKAGLDKPDDVSINAALGNPSARFNWINIRTYSGRIDLEQERDRWNKGKASGDQTSAMQSRRLTGEGAPKPSDRYALEREETPNEIRARLAETPELDPNSYHSAVLRSPENQRWVTAMDIAIGQAKCLNDPAMREVLVAIANWRMDKEGFERVQKSAGWTRLSVEAQLLISASHKYYEYGKFPAPNLVPLTPPSLITLSR
ncbi:hypothetical protein ALP01_04173 [Pseudomonas caricapapayae]|nr:hypothetical protein ALP01_04173 [Pseudomonas caricapapayae]